MLTMSKLRRNAIREIQKGIVQMIHDYVENLKAKGTYDDLMLHVKQFKLAMQIFDAFGETVDNYSVHDLFTTTDTDIFVSRRICLYRHLYYHLLRRNYEYTHRRCRRRIHHPAQLVANRIPYRL